MPDVDVIVVGGGGAGVAAAAAATAAGARVLVVSKEPLGSGDTRINLGAVVYPGRLPGDSAAGFARNLLTSGEGLSRPDLVAVMAAEGWRAVHLWEEAGATFNRDRDGRFSERVALRMGGHDVARSLNCIGSGMMMGTALRGWAARLRLQALEGVMATRILVEGGEVAGVEVLDPAAGEVRSIPCRAVVLATGSAGGLYYPHTDCVQACTGDGYALALDAGATLVDMEQVQFMPFACVSPRSMVGVFLGEGFLAGPHGVLRDARGDVLLTGVNRCNRAQVVRAMAAVHGDAGRAGPGGAVFLDLSPNWEHPDGVAYMERQLARKEFAQIRKAYGPEAGQGRVPFPVLPTAHYNMGGVEVTPDGQSAVPGLYAAGAAMGGLHGGNRLGSVAMAEAMVFGQRAGAAAARRALAARQAAAATGSSRGAAPRPGAAAATGDDPHALRGQRGATRPIAVIRRLQQTVWDRIGPARTGAGLQEALAELDRLAAVPLQVSPARRWNPEWRDAMQLRLLLTTARAMALAALARAETRGAHLRLDCPDPEPEPRHTLVSRVGAGMTVARAPVPQSG